MCTIHIMCVHFSHSGFCGAESPAHRHPVPLGSICRADHRSPQASREEQRVVRGHSAGGRGGCGGDLAAIGSTLREATAAAAGPTTGLAAAAADDVSIAVSQLFGRYGQEFQTVSNQLAAFHTEFVRTLNRGAAAYLNTESANGGRLFGQIEAGQRAVSAAAAAAPGGAYGQLVANTATNLESLYGAWSANPFPFLRQIIANQQVYWQQIAAALANAVQNFPALVANLPAAIDAAVQQFLAFNAAYYIQQIISSQIGFAQLFATTVGQGSPASLPGGPTLRRSFS